MSTNNPQKKKVVVSAQKPPVASRAAASAAPKKDELVFNKTTYIWMGAGVALIFLGLLMMSGGKMPSPDVWDDGIIYSFRRTVLAPIVILAGLAVEVVAIFKR